MIKRPRYGKEIRESLLAEISSGQSSVSQISKREHISGQTIRNWINETVTGTNGSEQGQIAALTRRNNELSLALGEMAFEIHVLKKFHKFLEQKKKFASLSGPLSPRKSGSPLDAQS